ncbi:MAG TPA: glycosyltransferase [Candidatus Paceibacterota bacterium]
MKEAIIDPRKKFLETKVKKITILTAAFLTLVYFIVITFLFQPANKWLFGALILGEVFHSFQILMFLYTIWNTEYMPSKKGRPAVDGGVDVFITVAGEPVDIVEETVQAALAMDYPDFKVHILNDGLVAKKDNWKDIEALAAKYGINCITRTVPGGAKAGNINNAMRNTEKPYIAIFDADHVPHTDFLAKTMMYFADAQVGYVQSPQYYKNHDLNTVTRGAWEQQELFFGPICKGKNRMNSATMCGTNMVISRKALEQVGGMSEESIAEDFLTGMLIHEKKWKSVYVPEVLAEGLAPEDFLSYSKQQFRWARGALDVIFKYNLLFRNKGLTFAQRWQYLSSVTFFLSGVIVLIDAAIPLFYFFFGQVPILSSTMLLAAAFLPYIFLTLFILQKSTNFSFTFSSLAFSNAGWYIHIKALFATITNRKSSFQITPKRQVQGNFALLVVPHIAYCALVVAGITFATLRDGVTASLVTNASWALLNIGMFAPFIYAALPHKEPKPEEMIDAELIESPKKNSRHAIYIAGLIGLICALSAFFFSHQSLRLDESQSLWQVNHTPAMILNIVARDVHVPLYHFVLYVWEYFLGTDVAVGRSLSLLFFALSIPLMYALGKKAYNRNVGLSGAVLLAISPFMNWFGNEIRMYSMLVFFVLANQYFFISLFKSQERRLWIGYALTALAGVYTHYFFAFFLASQSIFYLARRDAFPAGALKKFSMVAIGLIIAFAPWVAYVISQGSAQNTQPSLVAPSSVDLFNVFSQFVFGFQTDHLNTLLVSLWPITVLLAFLFLRKSRGESAVSSYFVAMLALPNILAFLVSVTVRPLFLSRYLIVSIPAMYLLLSWIISTYRPPLRNICRAGLVAIMLATLTIEIGSASTPVKEEYQLATEHLESHAKPQDIIVVSAPFTIYPFQYYYKGNTSVQTLPIWDRSEYGPIPAFDSADLPRQVEELAGSHDSLWLLLSYDQGYQEEVRQYFDSNYHLLWKEKYSPGVELYQYQLRY